MFTSLSNPEESVIKPISTVLEGVAGEKEKESGSEFVITLKLGDIIEIVSPNNEILNGKTFMIEYIDTQKIKLVNADTFQKTQLMINQDGQIADRTITEIILLSRNRNEGYARQNDLLTGTWINIYFGGDIPTIITGLITDLENDMIEILTIDKETIYIDFAYQGLPEDIPIENF